MSDSKEEETKVILVGESGVGKTNLINIITGGDFNENENSTSAASFLMKELKVKDKDYTIQLWDTIGNEGLRQLTKLFYNNSKIAIFVYDITRKMTFEELKNFWINDVEEKLGKDIIRGIVGNKIDLIFEEQVSEEEGEEYAKSIGALFLATSAKTDSPKKFEGFLTKLFEQYLNKNEAIQTGMKNHKKEKNIVLNNKKNIAGRNGKKCC